MNTSNKVIETHRLELWQFEPSTDGPFIVKLLNETGFIANIGDRGVRTLQDAKDYLIKGPLESYKQNGFGLFKVSLKSTNAPIGMCGLIRRPSLPEVDIGFAFLQAYWRNGYAYEASFATLEFAKKTVGLKRVSAITAMQNTASIKLLEKLGLKFEKIIQLPEHQDQSRYFIIDF